MVARKLALAFCAIGFLQTSFAGFERFWIFSKDALLHFGHLVYSELEWGLTSPYKLMKILY